MGGELKGDGRVSVSWKGFSAIFHRLTRGQRAYWRLIWSPSLACDTSDEQSSLWQSQFICSPHPCLAQARLLLSEFGEEVGFQRQVFLYRAILPRPSSHKAGLIVTHIFIDGAGQALRYLLLYPPVPFPTVKREVVSTPRAPCQFSQCPAHCPILQRRGRC
jgi:hypothetical protein